MTVKELYEWAKKNGAENYDIAKYNTVTVGGVIRELMIVKSQWYRTGNTPTTQRKLFYYK